MTKETKQQIYNDSVKYMSESTYISADDCSFRSGAMHQDPIAEKRGYNKAIEDMIIRLVNQRPMDHMYTVKFITEELMLLKK